MCIDHNAALGGQTVFKCQACWAGMKTNIQNSLSEAQIAPTIGMQHPLQPLALKHASMQHTNDCRLRSPHKEDSLYVHDGTYTLSGCSANGTKSESCAHGTLPPRLQGTPQLLECSTYSSIVSRPSAMLTPDKLEAQNLDCDRMSSFAGNISDRERREEDAFERQVGYCTTPNSIDHQHGPHREIAGEGLARCNHCLSFLPKEPTCKHDESDGSSTECPESDEAPSQASSAAVKHKLSKKERCQKYILDLIRTCEDSANASAPEDPNFKEHIKRMTELKKTLHTTLDKGRRCEDAADLNTMD